MSLIYIKMSMRQNTFSHKTRFDTEAKGNSEVAYNDLHYEGEFSTIIGAFIPSLKITKHVRINLHCIAITLQVIYQTREIVFYHISKHRGVSRLHYQPLFGKGDSAPSLKEAGEMWTWLERAVKVEPEKRVEPWRLWLLNLKASLSERRKKQDGSYSATRNCRARDIPAWIRYEGFAKVHS